MENLIPWDKIQYALTNPSDTPDEELVRWIDSSVQNRELWEEIKLTYLIAGELPAEFLPDRRTAWRKVESRIEKKERRRKISPFFLRVAASILLFAVGALSSWYFLHQTYEPQYAEVYSPFGHKTRVVLPDHTVVLLNGNSNLKYETTFQKERKVELSGEALFEVAKNPDKVFRLTSGDVKIEVYGTKFNFKHYPEDENTEVALLEGSVGFFNKDKLLLKMVPGEVTNLNHQTNHFHVDHEDLDMIVSWSTDELVIENKPFEEVLKYLERWYGVRFRYSGDLGVTQRLSFKVKTESLPELLATIGHLTSVKYKIEGKNIELSN
jgi:ferric-dicitrate binding protein FerR (iron transport regulator)